MFKSKLDIDKIGNEIRKMGISCDELVLENLQEYRISHKEAIANVFNILCGLSKKVHENKIVNSYRLKRLNSIITKLERFDDMRLSRMWDIAGCRSIVRNNRDLHKLLKLLKENEEIEIKKEKDYINQPKEDGYKSHHLYVLDKKTNKIVEIQLREQTHHNWATLVEISDLLFDAKLKEFNENKELLEFHKILSLEDQLDYHQRIYFFNIINKFKYFLKLSETFNKNYLTVREQWNSSVEKKKNRYFLIESNRDEFPKINAFLNYTNAEKEYFEIFKSRPNANIFLTKLSIPEYKWISLAYSNYILTFHSFFYKCLEILNELIKDSLNRREIINFFKYYRYYNALSLKHSENLIDEVLSIQKEVSKGNYISQKNGEEWVKDLQDQLSRITKINKELQLVLRTNIPNDFLIRKAYRGIMWYFEKVKMREFSKHRRRLK
ncbi:MAG TPA: hypothetical protein VK175_03330 [Leadbetterella sp.]|nr:hypothetical protein [Leadbetterella sp.]